MTTLRELVYNQLDDIQYFRNEGKHDNAWVEIESLITFLKHRQRKDA
jgi:hypothetical protein